MTFFKNLVNIWEFLFLGEGGHNRNLFEYGHIFTYTCPNGSGVGAIDRSDPLEHVFDPYCIVEVLRKIFRDEV